MKSACLAILICFVTLKGLSQNVTISERNIPLGKMMNIIRKQTGYYFSFSTGITGEVTNVSLNVKNKPLQAALDILFSKLPYTYLLKGKFILIVERNNNNGNVPLLFTLSGIVETENGEPIEGATILILNTKKGFTTNSAGQFAITGLSLNTILNISSIGYESKQIVLVDQAPLKIKLNAAIAGLDEALVVGYGKTSRRLITGNVAKVKGSDIVDQPVSNFVAALPGRVPGMLISQTNGLPGTSYKSEIRGLASIGVRLGIIPEQNILVLVDGIPFSPNANNLPTIPSGSALSAGRNVFDWINPNDIESIEILKDADATAIYGSRGANGIILVTTKKGHTGKRNFSFHFNTGIDNITRFPEMMSTTQYVKMRTDAINNDGDIVDNNTAPDLTKWDTTRTTDFRKLLLGGTGKINNFHMQIAGGSQKIQYLLSGAFHRQTTIFNDNFADNVLYSHSFLNYRSLNNKLKSSIGFIFSHDNNKSLSRDLTNYIITPPNAPSLYDSLGNLNWQQNGYSFNNPMALFKQTYNANTTNLLINSGLSYMVFKDFVIKLNAGINNISSRESKLQPRSSLNTYSSPNITGRSFFANTKLKSWIIEPQIEFERKISRGKLTYLMGATSQQVIFSNEYIAASGFKNDSFLTDLSYAAKVITTPKNTAYKYAGIFARLSYNYLDKYILNVTGRRDGSSRFGQGNQFGNFGAAGAAWIFTNEPIIKKVLPFISFGKLRMSYGVTGSDQIGDYKYLDSWMQTQNTYQGITGLFPVQPANPNYSWEVNKKFEGGFEFGMLNEKLFFSSIYYRNRTSNQIISVPLPAITGFDRLQYANFPVVVQNSGLEMILQMTAVKRKFVLNSKFLLTIPQNKLISFPGLANYLYANNNVYVGKSITSISGLTYIGVDKSTGYFRFKDFNNDGNTDYPNDYSVLGNQDPKFYGSWENTCKFKNFEFNIFLEFKNKKSYNYLFKIYDNNPPGFAIVNQPTQLANYWQKPEDNQYIQMPTASDGSKAYGDIRNFVASDGILSNASYIRFKTVSVSYCLPSSILKKLYLNSCKFYLSSNNLAIITPFKGTDPEVIDIFTLPPTRTISAGIQVNF